MENKYYTPSIEEFHVGFLFETYVDRFDEWKQNSVHNIYDFQSVFNGSFNPRFIRVKYLNEQDIESLGFIEDTYNGVRCFTKNNCQIFFFGDNVISIDLFAGNFRNQYFRGLVKNKSELKIILNQISNGIISK